MAYSWSLPAATGGCARYLALSSVFIFVFQIFCNIVVYILCSALRRMTICSFCYQQSVLARIWASIALLDWHWSLALVQCVLPESWICHSYTLHCTSSTEIINTYCHLIILRQETGQNRTWNWDIYLTSDLNRNWLFVFKSVKYLQTKEQQYHNGK
jgi:hypothetical protein